MNISHYFEHALLGNDWADNVRIDSCERGNIVAIEPDATIAAGETVIRGYALAGFPNVHSHAFQRAMRGLAESSAKAEDSFWGWRDVMYRFAGMLAPQDLEVIAAQLYVEMIKSGFTSVAEFHYLHHQTNGKPYLQAAEMSLAIVEAAEEAGIGLTHLPVLYMSADFGGRALAPAQARFGNTVGGFFSLLEDLQAAMSDKPQIRLGCAMHSLRAVGVEARRELLSFLAGFNPDGVIHIHIAEQMKEVLDCRAQHGQSPVEMLLDQHEVNSQWCLVHATHISESEAQALAKSGAVVGLCPTTEANLGDGFFPLRRFLECGGDIGLGSDSNISVSPIEEMRWLEYGQRLVSQSRNVVSTAASPHTGSSLVRRVLGGGRRALGADVGAIGVGFRADIAVLDGNSLDLVYKAKKHILDSAIFCGNNNSFRDVMCGGRWLVKDYVHVRQEIISRRYRALMAKLAASL